MSELIVEIHVPLTPSDVGPGEYPFPWIDTVMDYLADLDGAGGGELWDDGEELGDDYVFPVIGASEEELLGLARSVAGLPGVPSGVYAIVTDTDGVFQGTGRRVEVE